MHGAIHVAADAQFSEAETTLVVGDLQGDLVPMEAQAPERVWKLGGVRLRVHGCGKQRGGEEDGQPLHRSKVDGAMPF